MNGIELAVKIREICPSILIVFISAYDEYIRDSNLIGGDYYIVKPYKKRNNRDDDAENANSFEEFAQRNLYTDVWKI